MSEAEGGPAAVTPDHDVRGVLRVPAFRKLWTALSLSSFGDWLGLLALTALAPRLSGGSYADANLAIAGVFILRLAPAIVIGPLGGVLADRLDRRYTMVICDIARFALFLSIPLVGTLWWLFAATFLIEAASLVWIPAKEATLPNIVPRERLETANQLSLFTTYGSAPVAAAVFAGLSLVSGMLDNAVSSIDEVDLALFFNAATFLVSALTILRLHEIPSGTATPDQDRPGVWRTLVEGWSFVGRTRLVRGLVAGMLGAFAAGGAVVGLARTFVADLGAGDPGYGLLFGTVFCGLASGMFFGPRLLPDFSRRRLFGLAIFAAGLALALLALIPNMVIAVLVTYVLGGFSGVAWVTGYTLLGLEVADDVRGRTFAFVQTMVRVVLVLVLAVAPLLAAAFGQHEIRVTDAMALTYNGAAITFLLAGLLAAVLGLVSFRHMDDRRGVPVVADLTSAYQNEPVGVRATGAPGGFFIALEGGEGAGKSTQLDYLATWLRELGHEVVVTFEPGATDAGRRLRALLLDHTDTEGTDHPRLAARTEALLFAADRAEHVSTVVAPALRRGAVVITDRYVDSSVAYQGAGRDLGATEIARLSRWATDGLRPHLTVLLDLPVATGLARVSSRASADDKVESEPAEFHDRVRERFREQARRGGSRYLVVDATAPVGAIAATIRERVEPLLPLTAADRAAQVAAREKEERDRAAAAAAEAESAAREAAEREAAETARQEAAQAKRLAAEQAAEQTRRDREERRAREAAEREERRAAQQAEKAAAQAAKAAATEQERAARAREREQQAAADRRVDVNRPQPTRAHPTGRSENSQPPAQQPSLADDLFGGPADRGDDR